MTATPTEERLVIPWRRLVERWGSGVASFTLSPKTHRKAADMNLNGEEPKRRSSSTVSLPRRKHMVWIQSLALSPWE